MAPFSDPSPTSNVPSHSIEFTFDILDYIFAFLRCDPESLLACSEAHPGFSPIVERHLYYYILITTSPNFKTTGRCYSLEPPQLIKLLSETPQIINHVRVLQVALYGHYHLRGEESRIHEEIAQILPRFCALETIFFTSSYPIRSWWKLPQTLKTAVEGCLRLPTLRNVHFGDLHIPLSILDHNPNIDCLWFSGIGPISDVPDDANASLQLKSLIIDDVGRPRWWNWVKRRIIKLQSMQCAYVYSCEQDILEALEICSGTLNDLDLSLERQYGTAYHFDTRVAPYSEFPRIPQITISSLPLLQHLILRVDVHYEDNRRFTSDGTGDQFCVSCLPSSVEILKTASSLQRVTIELCVRDTRVWRCIDFSSLAALAESTSFRHIDFYCLDVTYGSILSKLAHYESLKKWIEQGVLVIHAEEAAPGNPRLIH